MKKPLVLLYLFFALNSTAQERQSPNVFIITTDGFRWQEVFEGANPQLLSNPSLVADTVACHHLFGGESPEIRRNKLLPFFWQVIARQGQLSGNRNFNNKVNVANFYKISYPGYQEMLTGIAPTRLNPNWAVNSRRSTVLESANDLVEYKGKVVAFCSWNILPFILRENETKIPVNAGYEKVSEENDPMGTLINQVQSYLPVEHTRNDLLTYVAAKNYLQQHHPKVLFLGFGETDEYAHRGNYDQYLMKAHQFDRLLSDLWYFVQSDPFYRNNTTFIITTDHGRGSNSKKWGTHGFWVRGSGEVWTAFLGPSIEPFGEMIQTQTTWLKQIAGKVNSIIQKNPPPTPTLLTEIKSIPISLASDEKNIGSISSEKNQH